jgi:hypothetical protein
MKKTETGATKPATTAEFDEALRRQLECFRDGEGSEALSALAKELHRRLDEEARRR